jgi:methionyl-tRNA formyltransferase
MKLIFAGTPPFAAQQLAAIHTAGHEIVLVLTQPDRPAGRGMRLTLSAVAAAATARGLTVEKPLTLKSAESQALVQAACDRGAEVMVVAAYGLLLPQAVLDMPPRGCINIHGSLLPRWRGAAPVQRAIEAGDDETGIDIMQMEAGLDTGPVLLRRVIPIAAEDTSASLFAKLGVLGEAAITEALANLAELTPKPQSAEGVTYAKKLEKSEAIINWQLPASQILRKLRAFDPFPGCETMLNNEKLKIWRAVSAKNASNTAPGIVLDVLSDQLRIACGEDAIAVTEVQRPGGKRISVSQYLQAVPIAIGTQLT